MRKYYKSAHNVNLRTFKFSCAAINENIENVIGSNDNARVKCNSIYQLNDCIQ